MEETTTEGDGCLKKKEAESMIYDREKQNAELANFSILRYEPPKSIT
jgi:hypothetical protein